MSRNGKNKNLPSFKIVPPRRIEKVTSLLDTMKDGREYESIISCAVEGLNLSDEIKKSISEIENVRNRPVVCYLVNIINSGIKGSIAIDGSDDLSFSEIIDNVDTNSKDLDIILVTPGGSSDQVAKFVNKIRPRFDNISFILPDQAMSAGTIFCMAGDELIMDSRAYIGPIDPQVLTKDGRYVPAQSILTLLKSIQVRGEESLKKGNNPFWTDIQILNSLDAKEIGIAINASNHSIELVTDYLKNYKFKNWNTHSNGTAVTDNDKLTRAKEIASQLCNHELWKTHSRGITREMAHEQCRLKIEHTENIDGLNRAIRRFWALIYWIFEKSLVRKIFISKNYSLFRSDIPVQIGTNTNN